MKRFYYKMAVNTGVISISILCYALLTGLIMSAGAHVIMRRESATTQQTQQQENASIMAHNGENRTVTTLKLQTQQNVNENVNQNVNQYVTNITKLTPTSAAIFGASTAETTTNNITPQESALKEDNAVTEYIMVTESAAFENAETSDKQRLSIPTTTAAMPNTIDTAQELKDKHKISAAALEKFALASTNAILTTTETTMTVMNNQDQYIAVSKEITQPTTTTETLLQHKNQLSLEDTNEIQISNSAKQAKFLNDNSTNFNSLSLPNNADAWTLIGMKSISPHTNQTQRPLTDYLETSNNKSSLLDASKEKTVTDWMHIVQMGVDKSVRNALTDDDETTLASQKSIESTSIKSTTILPNETTTLAAPATSVNSQQSVLLSANDNVDSMTTLKANDTRYHELNAKNKEKIAHNEELEEHEELKSETTMRSSQEENTMMPTTLKMTTVSTPATALASTTVSTLEERRTHIDGLASEITESEKGNKDNKNENIIDEIETTTISVGEQIAKTIKTTTNIPSDTTTTVRPSILAANVKEVINLTAITTTTTTSQPSTDIDQIGTKSNLETPTTTTKTILETTTKIIKSTEAQEEKLEETTTTTTETTPTTSVQSENSSAITNQTSKDDGNNNDIDNDVISATTDSLGAQSTSNFELLYSTKIPPTTTERIAAEIITTTNHNVDETNVTKDTITSTTISTTSPTAKPTQEVQEVHTTETTTTTASNNNVFELPIGFTTTTFKPISIPETTIITTTTTDIAPTSNTTEMSNATAAAVKESTSTEATLTNFIDDSTTTTTTTTTTAPATIAAPNSTISLATSTSTPSTVLSVQTTNTAELQPISTETTTLITEKTPTTTTTTTKTTTTTTELALESTTPSITTNSSSETTSTTELPKTTTAEVTTTTTTTTETQTTTIIETPTKTTTTTDKTIKMIPTTTHFEAAPSAPISTTVNPLDFPDGMKILHAQLPKSTPDNPETDVNVVIAISVSVIGVVALILLVAFLYLMRKRQKATSYGQRCRPVSLDAYSLDNVSVLGSVRRKGALRASKRSYGNAAFDDPSLRHNVLQTAADLAKFVERRSSIFEEFRDVPQIFARPEEIPEGCENKNRYANVIPLPETRVILQRRNDDDTTEYINANYVRGPKDAPNYYIACQAPLESTVQDFWRMIWEQQSRVIIQATDLIENGVEKCAEYLPPSVTLDNHTTFGDFQVTLKNREVKDKYAISTIMLKNTISNTSREITHYWYKWPEIGVPTEEAPIIAMLLEARSSLKSYALEVTNELKEKSNSSLGVEHENGDAKESLTALNGAGPSSREINGNVTDKAKSIARNQGPLTIHCSPGTGRTGTIISCDIAIRSLETTKSLDIPQIVYYIRRGRASAVQTKEQYEFIYKVANVYAMKITNVPNDN